MNKDALKNDNGKIKLLTFLYSLLFGNELLFVLLKADGYNVPPDLDFSASCNERAIAVFFLKKKNKKKIKN